MGTERRKFIRLSLDPPLAVNFRFIPFAASIEPAQERESLIKNISVGGGLLIEFLLKSKDEQDKLLSGKEKICFEKGIPGVKPPYKILGKVVWLKRIDKTDLFYEAGISFENINEKTQEDILHAMIDLAFVQSKL